MILFIYDHTFEGLLTCIFDAYFRNTYFMMEPYT